MMDAGVHEHNAQAAVQGDRLAEAHVEAVLAIAAAIEHLATAVGDLAIDRNR